MIHGISSYNKSLNDIGGVCGVGGGEGEGFCKVNSASGCGSKLENIS